MTQREIERERLLDKLALEARIEELEGALREIEAAVQTHKRWWSDTHIFDGIEDRVRQSYANDNALYGAVAAALKKDQAK